MIEYDRGDFFRFVVFFCLKISILIGPESLPSIESFCHVAEASPDVCAKGTKGIMRLPRYPPKCSIWLQTHTLMVYATCYVAFSVCFQKSLFRLAEDNNVTPAPGVPVEVAVEEAAAFVVRRAEIRRNHGLHG